MLWFVLSCEYVTKFYCCLLADLISVLQVGTSPEAFCLEARGEEIWLQPTVPEVTFFFFSGNGEGGRACGLSGVIGRPAGVLPRVLAESIDYDERGGVRRLVEMKHHVLGGLNGLPVVEPANLWLRHAGHTCVKARHLPVWHRAAGDWLDENGLLADGRLL